MEITVATTSKQINWLFSNNFINGNANNGKKSVSPKIDDQWDNADNTLSWKTKWDQEEKKSVSPENTVA